MKGRWCHGRERWRKRKSLLRGMEASGCMCRRMMLQAVTTRPLRRLVLHHVLQERLT
jgi:hypothetical protein